MVNSTEKHLMAVDKRTYVYINDDNIERFTERTLDNVRTSRLSINKIIVYKLQSDNIIEERPKAPKRLNKEN